MRSHLLLSLFLLTVGTGLRAQEPICVIVNVDSGVTRLTRTEARDIFLGRQKRLPSGLVAVPVEQVEPLGDRTQFYRLLVNLPLQEVRAYWARLYFSGQAQPPRQTSDVKETLDLVAANRGAIGFVPLSQLDRRVRSVLRLDP